MQLTTLRGPQTTSRTPPAPALKPSSDSTAAAEAAASAAAAKAAAMHDDDALATGSIRSYVTPVAQAAAADGGGGAAVSGASPPPGRAQGCDSTPVAVPSRARMLSRERRVMLPILKSVQRSVSLLVAGFPAELEERGFREWIRPSQLGLDVLCFWDVLLHACLEIHNSGRSSQVVPTSALDTCNLAADAWAAAAGTGASSLGDGARPAGVVPCQQPLLAAGVLMATAFGVSASQHDRVWRGWFIAAAYVLRLAHMMWLLPGCHATGACGGAFTWRCLAPGRMAGMLSALRLLTHHGAALPFLLTLHVGLPLFQQLGLLPTLIAVFARLATLMLIAEIHAWSPAAWLPHSASPEAAAAAAAGQPPGHAHHQLPALAVLVAWTALIAAVTLAWFAYMRHVYDVKVWRRRRRRRRLGVHSSTRSRTRGDSASHSASHSASASDSASSVSGSGGEAAPPAPVAATTGNTTLRPRRRV